MHRRNLIRSSGALLAAAGLQSPPAPVLSAAAGEPSPVIVELFTSQGCSSCPPAEALLGELAQRANVVALAWHVDYWNNLGWTDPYASSEWTQRQRRYARALGEDVYTPALIVNGTRMVVGSDRSAVDAALAISRVFPVAVELARTVHGLRAQIGSRPEGAVVSLIVYDGARSTGVRAGENAGRKLREIHIVRSTSIVDPEASGVSLPDIAANQGAVLLVQDRELAVLGAGQVRPASVDPL